MSKFEVDEASLNLNPLEVPLPVFESESNGFLQLVSH